MEYNLSQKLSLNIDQLSDKLPQSIETSRFDVLMIVFVKGYIPYPFHKLLTSEDLSIGLSTGNLPASVNCITGIGYQ